MPTEGKDPTGAVVREAVNLRRYENGLARDVAKDFRKAADQLKVLMSKYDVTERRSDMRKLLAAANEVFDKLYRNVEQYTNRQLLDLAKLESDFARGILQTAVGAAVDIKGKRIGKTLAKSILETDPIQGEVMKKWWSQQKASTATAFRQQIQLGMSEHESIPQLVRRIRGRTGLIEKKRREAEALVRTAVNEVATKAKLATFEANDDITQAYELVVTFDSRTSDICIALDGKTYRYDDPARRMPPFHFNCRTTIAPVLDWSAAGLEPPEEGVKWTRAYDAEGKPLKGLEGRKYVKSSTRYSEWLKDQPVAVQNEILGKGRAQLWRDGKIRLDQLVRQDGSTVTLGEFRKRLGIEGPITVERAGMGWDAPALRRKIVDDELKLVQSVDDDDIERAIVYDRDGNRLIDKTGVGRENITEWDVAGQIEFTDAELETMRNTKGGVTFTHSHPTTAIDKKHREFFTNGFSDNDIRFAKSIKNIEEMRAVGRHGRDGTVTYSMRNLERLRTKPGIIDGQPDMLVVSWHDLQATMRRWEDRVEGDWFWEGRKDVFGPGGVFHQYADELAALEAAGRTDELWHELNYLALRGFADEVGVKFTRTIRRDFPG